jgi:predicted flap endonuclease-1-like 5' DNA nuclease
MAPERIPMNYKIDDIEGIGPAYAKKLAAADIKTTQDLLDKCGARKGRKAIAKLADISEKLLLTWTNMADMVRIKGIGPQYAELLEAAGVDTIKELRTRNLANLTAKLAEVQKEKKTCKTAPAESVIAGWIEQAKDMDPAVSH